VAVPAAEPERTGDMDIDFKTKISELNVRQRDWFVTAMISMVLADGNIDRAEVDFLLKATSLIKDEPTKDRMKKFIQFKTLPPLGAPGAVDRKVAMTMIIDLIRVAVADKDFADKEKDMIRQIGHSLSFAPDEIDKLVLYGFELMTA
jgi:uncharacterized tellurite resistance protein B-like protein